MGMPGAPALGRAWTVLLCADFVVFVVLTMFRHHDYCSFDSDVSILKPRLGESTEGKTTQSSDSIATFEGLV